MWVYGRVLVYNIKAIGITMHVLFGFWCFVIWIEYHRARNATVTEEQVDGKTLVDLNDDDLIHLLGLTPLKVNTPDEGEAF